jgi:hypothetical protein
MTQSAENAARAAQKPGYFFFPENALPLDESGMMARIPFNPEVTEKLDLSPLQAGSRGRVLFRSEEHGFSLIHGWLGENYPLPRHNHSTDCLYYVLRGSLFIGTKEFGPGSGFFVSARTAYTFRPGKGGVEYLEFRNAAAFDIQILETAFSRWESFLDTAKGMEQIWAATRPAD